MCLFLLFPEGASVVPEGASRVDPEGVASVCPEGAAGGGPEGVQVFPEGETKEVFLAMFKSRCVGRRLKGQKMGPFPSLSRGMSRQFTR